MFDANHMLNDRKQTLVCEMFEKNRPQKQSHEEKELSKSDTDQSLSTRRPSLENNDQTSLINLSYLRFMEQFRDYTIYS